jgi:hypothetical protein
MPASTRCVAARLDVMTLAGLNANRGGLMKPIDLLALLPAINNGWAFAAFVIVVAVTLYFNRRGTP